MCLGMRISLINGDTNLLCFHMSLISEAENYQCDVDLSLHKM